MQAACIRAISRGFTLIEMLISLAIFALIGVSAYQVLASAALVSEREQVRTERMHKLHKTFRIIERDLRQIVDRPVRDELGMRVALHGSEERPLELTRAGNENPLGLPRSDLLRVAYSLRELEDAEQGDSGQQVADEEGLQLLRTLWPMPDSSLEAPLIEQPLLDNVKTLTLRFMSSDLDWFDAWPVQETQDGNADELAEALPVAIEVTLEVGGIGEFSRVVSLR